ERSASPRAGPNAARGASQAVGHPVMLIDRVGQLAMLVLRDERVVDDRAIGALRFELGRRLAQARRVPETGPHFIALADDLLLLQELREQNVERAHGHNHEDDEHGPGDEATFLERLHQAIRIRRSGSCCWSCHNIRFPSKISYVLSSLESSRPWSPPCQVMVAT